MKNLLCLFMILSINGIKAQVLTPEEINEINQNNQIKITSDKIQEREKTREVISSIAKETFTLKSSKLFPKARSYSDSEIERINYLSCLENILQKNKGGYEAPKIARRLLETALINDNFDVNSCLEISDQLLSFPESKMVGQEKSKALMKALDSASPDVSGVISRLYFEKEKCAPS